jgi:hypothetical protein
VFAAIATGLTSASVYVTGAIPLANIDDQNVRRFAVDFWGSVSEAVGLDVGYGRFRPLYWVFEGALGAATGNSGTVLHAGRLLCLAAATALSVLLARRLGAPLAVAVVLALVPAWSIPAIDVWTRGGPAEAFAQPLALAALLLVLRSDTPRGIALASFVGLVACSVKESSAPWIAAALLARAICAGRSRLPVATWVSIAGALAQFMPGVLAAVLLPRFSGSYLEHIIVSLRAPPREAALSAFHAGPFALLLGSLGLAAIAARRASEIRRPWSWPVEDLVVVGVASAAVAETIALGFIVDRYHLPLVASLALLAARGAAGVSRTRAVIVTVAMIAPVVFAGAVRSATYARASAARHRLDERLRQQVAAALEQSGGVRIHWVPADVERPIGAVTHLRADGITGQVQFVPCTRAPAGQEEIFRGLFAPYSSPIGRDVPSVVAVSCGGVAASLGERACVLDLPFARSRSAGYRCSRMPDWAALRR